MLSEIWEVTGLQVPESHSQRDHVAKFGMIMIAVICNDHKDGILGHHRLNCYIACGDAILGCHLFMIKMRVLSEA